MRIEPSDKPIPYFNKRDQRRLFMQTLMLCVVIAAIFKAGNPDNWTWLTGKAADDQQSQKAKTPVTDADRDFRIRNQQPQLNPDEFLSPKTDTVDKAGAVEKTGVVKKTGAVEKTGAGNETGVGNAPEVAGKTDAEKTNAGGSEVLPKTVVSTVKAKSASEAPDWPSHLLEVPAKVLASIEDNTLEVRTEESSAFYAVLARIRDLDASVARKAASKNTGWVVLMDEPEFYRGRLVTIRGDLHRLQAIKANRNDYGIEQLYTAWISTRDRPKDPIHIFTTSIPDGIPLSQNLSKPVAVTVVGYFFKKEGYFTDPTKAAGTHVAPLVLAKSLQLKVASRAIVDDDSQVLTYIIVFACVLFVVVFLWTWSNRRSDAAFKRGVLKQATAASDEAIEALKDVNAKELGEQLRDLAKEES